MCVSGASWLIMIVKSKCQVDAKFNSYMSILKFLLLVTLCVCLLECALVVGYDNKICSFEAYYQKLSENC